MMESILGTITVLLLLTAMFFVINQPFKKVVLENQGKTDALNGLKPNDKIKSGRKSYMEGYEYGLTLRKIYENNL